MRMVGAAADAAFDFEKVDKDDEEEEEEEEEDEEEEEEEEEGEKKEKLDKVALSWTGLCLMVLHKSGTLIMNSDGFVVNAKDMITEESEEEDVVREVEEAADVEEEEEMREVVEEAVSECWALMLDGLSKKKGTVWEEVSYGYDPRNTME